MAAARIRCPRSNASRNSRLSGGKIEGADSSVERTGMAARDFARSGEIGRPAARAHLRIHHPLGPGLSRRRDCLLVAVEFAPPMGTHRCLLRRIPGAQRLLGPRNALVSPPDLPL